MRSTKRLIVLTTGLLGMEAAVGTALAGVYIEGDMDALTGVVLVIFSIIVSVAGTLWGVWIAAEKARKADSRAARALGHLLYSDLHNASPAEAGEILYDIKDLLVKLVEKEAMESATKKGPKAGRPWED